MAFVAPGLSFPSTRMGRITHTNKPRVRTALTARLSMNFRHSAVPEYQPR